MKPIPIQEQVIGTVIEYEFDVGSLLAIDDAIANVTWNAPTGLSVINSTITGTKISGFISVEPTAMLHNVYTVSFKVTSVGAPTPVTPELSFSIRAVPNIVVMQI